MSFRAVVVASALLTSMSTWAGDAKAAYDAKDFGGCATAYQQLAAKAVGEGKVRHLYNAACCLALAGQPSKALEVLETVLELEPERAVAAKADTDLSSLARLPRFVAALDKADAKLARDRKTQNVALADELLRMVELDQAARNAAIEKAAVPPSKEWDTIRDLDRKHCDRLKAIVAKHGWPGRKLVGWRAARGAWLLVQHATHELPFMQQGLALMKAAGDDVSRIDVAYLEDRVRLMQGKPQLYGTQFQGSGASLKPQPIEDEAHVDERRRALGLGSLEEALQEVISAYAAQPSVDAGR